MAELPVIPKVSSILIHTGNIVNWNRLKKKLTQRPTEELAECLGSTLVTWLSTADKTQLQYETSVVCCNSKFIEKLPAESRQELKLTVKICLYKLHAESVKEVVSQVLCELDSGHIETVLLSVPEDRRSWNDIQPIWEAMENLVEQEKIFSLGVSDLNREQLEELYNAAKVKPIINQVNMDSCCAPPPELLSFAKENDIQLLTHNDPTDVLPKERLQEVVGQSISDQDSQSWEPCWVVRYSVLLKMRGIVKTKGYIVKACRNIGP